MRITFHAHRPTGLCRNTSAVEDSSTQRPTQADANEQLVKTVHFGFFKVRVHRKTAAQASLLAQLRGQAGAVPAQPASTSTAQASSSQTSLVIVRSDSKGSDISSLSSVGFGPLPELAECTGLKYREELLKWINGDENCKDVESTDYRGQKANETRLRAYERVCGWLTSWDQPDWKKLELDDLNLNTWPPLPKNFGGINVRLEL